MRIGSNTPSAQLPVETQIEGELMNKELKQQKAEGEATVKMIESAAEATNRPLTEGPVGRRINVAV
jgi:hypothetical protein